MFAASVGVQFGMLVSFASTAPATMRGCSAAGPAAKLQAGFTAPDAAGTGPRADKLTGARLGIATVVGGPRADLGTLICTRGWPGILTPPCAWRPGGPPGPGILVLT